MMKYILRFGMVAAFLFILAWTSSFSQARWATPEDAEAASDFMNSEFWVEKDGTYKAVHESVHQILREGGRHLSTEHLYYNSRAMRLKVELAETINGNTKIPVDSEFIEDKPLASRLNGFDELNMVSIAYPKVSVGSKIHNKYTQQRKEVAIPNHFSDRVDFGTNWYTKARSVIYHSPMPLFVEKNDPNGKVDITQTKDGDSFVTTLKLKEPIFTHVIDEQWPSLNRKDQTWVVVSTTKNYSDLANGVAEKYERVLSAPLPPVFEKIVEAAKKEKKTVDQINKVTSLLADEVRYMGDWRPVNGGNIPRPLEVIAKTKFGDCKDFASSTTAMLRKLGLQANVAWVERNVQPTPIPSIAFDAAFNHAILKAVDPADGKVYWVDPTNFASFAQGVFEDILDRPALVILQAGARGNSKLEQIPAGHPGDALKQSLSHIVFVSDGGAQVDAKIDFRGRSASFFTGALLKQSKEHIDHYIITALTDEDRLRWKEIEPYDLSSRVTKDFSIHARFGEADYSLRTTAGPAVYLSQRLHQHLIRLETKKRVSDLFMGHPDTVRDVDFLAGAKLVGSKPPECTLDSPWVKASRKVIQTAAGLRIEDVRENKRSLITNAELKSKEFSRFQKKLKHCFDRVAVVFEAVTGRRVSSK